jgi:hypothetical protein
MPLSRLTGTKPLDCTSAREPVCFEFQRVAAGIEHRKVRCIAGFGLQLARDLGEAQRLIPQLSISALLTSTGIRSLGPASCAPWSE